MFVFALEFSAEGVFSGGVVFDGGGDESFVGAGAVEDFPEVGATSELFVGARVDGFFYLFDLHFVVLQGLDQELLEDVVAVFWLFFFHQLRLVDG